MNFADVSTATNRASQMLYLCTNDGNWLQTIPGKSWWIGLRMYGPEQAWVDKTWRPGEIELVK